MPNMSYCRFTSTRTDLDDCLEAIRQDKCLSEMEVHASRNMFKEFLTFCRDYDIIDHYDSELVDELFRNLKEHPDDDE